MSRIAPLLKNTIKTQRLLPTKTTTIGVHPGTLGYQVQKLVVEQHCFKAPHQPALQNVALLFSHCNGFNKETMHPLIRRVVAGIHQQDQYKQTDLSVFAWDARSHGDSARLNEGTFLDSYSWFDHAMDTQQVITSFGLQKEYDAVIGVGHSFGASAMLLLEFLFPNSFSGICAIEPVMANGIESVEKRAKSPILSSLKRRDTWPNKMACYESLVSRPFWNTLHPEVLALYVNDALYETADGTVKLKTPKEQEYVSALVCIMRHTKTQFIPPSSDQHLYTVGYFGGATAYSSLRAVTIPLELVYADKSTYVTVDPLALPDLNPKHIRSTVIPGTHMVSNERPDAIVPHVIDVMDRALVNATKGQPKSKL
ncbi:hypothetical protein [Absidia glauca]|uniref:AB hydrolase-1 domain-containing protein n=1 Tax=Absidia glauca TaxID=4829 RepID=A0A163K3T5_ABSGL|nr:hypothetical protein [Absidia glauca]